MSESAFELASCLTREVRWLQKSVSSGIGRKKKVFCCRGERQRGTVLHLTYRLFQSVGVTLAVAWDNNLQSAFSCSVSLWYRHFGNVVAVHIIVLKKMCKVDVSLSRSSVNMQANWFAIVLSSSGVDGID